MFERYTLEEEAAQAMRNAVKNGVVDTVLYPFGDPFVPSLMGWAEAQNVAQQDPQTFEALENPHSQRWQENVLPSVIQQAQDVYTVGELARFTVPKGSVGFVRFLDQVLNDLDGNMYPTNQFYWGSPVFKIPDVMQCRWYLTLDYFDGTVPPQFTFSDPLPFTSSVLPGVPYPDLHEIPGLWYPAHAPRDMMKLIVPGGQMLRFFFWSGPTTEFWWEATGRLAGYTQSTYNDQATNNARYL